MSIGGGRGRGRSRPSPLEMEYLAMPPSGMMGYYFPWNQAMGTYDTSSYNPLYSDNTVSINDINILLQEMQSQPLFRPFYTDPLVKWFFCLFCGIYFGMPLLMLLGSTVTIGFFFVIPIAFIGTFVAMIFIMCRVASNSQKRQTERKSQMDPVIAKHQNSTFAGKNVVLRMPMHGSYIAIEFLFRMNDAQDQPMMVMPSMAGAPHMNMYQHQAQPQLGNGFGIGNQPQPFNRTNQIAPIF